MRIAVFGASGFVGAALVEDLLARPEVEVVPCINRIGNAWRLTRAQMPFRSVDIRSSADLDSALEGVTHVVNCTRGGSEVMLQGLKNLLSACKKAKIERFVHVSSVSVYGNYAAPGMEREDAPTNPEPGSYGWEKLKQDDMVQAARASDFETVVLCPPNISGIFSSFVYNVLSDIRAGTFALVDGGARPNSTVDVDNLVHAITLSLVTEKSDGRRIFVTDGPGNTWKEMAESLTQLAEVDGPLPSISAEDIAVPPTSKSVSRSLWRSLKHLASSDVREALRRDPGWARIDMRIRSLVAKSGVKMEDRLRLSIEGPEKVKKVTETGPYTSRYMAVQLRGITYDLQRARYVLGYEPVLTFANSMKRYCEWYKSMYGFGEDYWPLARAIETFRVD